MAGSTKAKRRNAAQFAADGFAALVEKLGMAEAIRYVQLYRQGAGDYTRERREWLDVVSSDQSAKLMAGTQKKSPHRQARRTAARTERSANG